jgi:hypothetical protein
MPLLEKSFIAPAGIKIFHARRPVRMRAGMPGLGYPLKYDNSFSGNFP